MLLFNIKAVVILCLAILCIVCAKVNAQNYSRKIDSMMQSLEGIKSKEVSIESPIRQNGDTYISSVGRSVIVKTWDEPRVKISTFLYYRGEDRLTDAQWFERLGITEVNRGNLVDIHSYYRSSPYFNVKDKGVDKIGYTGSLILFSGDGKNIGSIDSKRVVTIFVPKWSRLEINASETEFFFLSDIARIEATVAKKSSIEAQNIGELILHSITTDFNGGDIEKAEIYFTGGNFKAGKIGELKMESSASTIIAGTIKKAVIRSTQDDYDLDEVGTLTGRKLFKTLRIENLTKYLNIDGENADIKVRNISETVDTIKVIDKYCDIRLSLGDLQNYVVDYNCVLSKVYADFAKSPGIKIRNNSTGTPLQSTVTLMKDTSKYIYINVPEKTQKFTAKAGNGKTPYINIYCINSFVDFR